MIRRWLRRLVVLGLLGGAAWAVKQYLEGDAIPASEAGPGFPKPLPTPTDAPPAAAPTAAGSEAEPAAASEAEPTTVEPEPITVETPVDDADGPADPGAGWVPAEVGMAGPDAYPVKAKLNSGIYHLPGMLNYDRTVPDRWYTSAATAEADGLRRAKR